MQLPLNFSIEQINTLMERAERAGFTDENPRARIQAYFCAREKLGEPVKRGGRRDEAIQATRHYHQKKRKSVAKRSIRDNRND